jgi:hypothetical protein
LKENAPSHWPSFWTKKAVCGRGVPARARVASSRIRRIGRMGVGLEVLFLKIRMKWES